MDENPTLQKAASPLRRSLPGWLIALTLTTFTFSTDDYLVAGVLPGIADDLDVSEAAVGQLVTVFSLVLALAAPVASVLTATWARRPLFTAALAVFAAANFAMPLVASFPVLMALRVAAALAAAIVVPGALGAAAALAPPERQGRYMGTVFAGLTTSLLLGVPLGTWVGAVAGWQGAFVLGGLLGVASLAALYATLPEPPRGEALRLADRLTLLARPALLVGLAATAVAVLGNLMVVTYLAVYLRDLAGVGPTGLGVIFVLAGAAGIAGSQLGGPAADRWGAERALLMGCGAFALVMVGLVGCWPLRPAPLVLVVPLLLLWSAAAWWIPPAASARLLRLAGPAGAQALALNSSAVYLGVAAGGAAGGVLLDAYGSGALPAGAAAAQLVALALFGLASRRATQGKP
ncbi:MFS transporter [Streptomyces sp. CMB-StM0423]|uniref:MFS transporter n=1 Tax=Streptomyces sp. CMB-StM0423 TaxID=2059884 RepID=UPI000C7078F1|nr:MFS transporter [Streptomyces sp. CMB-StM0423]AUH41566.1 MFS transporter [Streptomyces sp. CMB-StM0423]